MNAAKMALGMGARVTILDRSVTKMQYIDDVFGGHVATLMSNPIAIARAVARADLLVGAVLIPGAAAPKLVTRSMVSGMKKGSVIVDVAVDQGGCIEMTHPTTHSDPVLSMKAGRSSVGCKTTIGEISIFRSRSRSKILAKVADVLVC